MLSFNGHTCKFFLQQIMSDKWMNLGYDNQELKPYSEPTPDFKDERRIGKDSLKVHGASVCFFIYI